jgi:hypothetical protein
VSDNGWIAVAFLWLVSLTVEEEPEEALVSRAPIPDNPRPILPRRHLRQRTERRVYMPCPAVHAEHGLRCLLRCPHESEPHYGEFPRPRTRAEALGAGLRGLEWGPPWPPRPLALDESEREA